MPPNVKPFFSSPSARQDQPQDANSHINSFIQMCSLLLHEGIRAHRYLTASSGLASQRTSVTASYRMPYQPACRARTANQCSDCNS